MCVMLLYFNLGLMLVGCLVWWILVGRFVLMFALLLAYCGLCLLLIVLVVCCYLLCFRFVVLPVALHYNRFCVRCFFLFRFCC